MEWDLRKNDHVSYILINPSQDRIILFSKTRVHED